MRQTQLKHHQRVSRLADILDIIAAEVDEILNDEIERISPDFFIADDTPPIPDDASIKAITNALSDVTGAAGWLRDAIKATGDAA